MGKEISDLSGFTIIKRIGVGARSTIYLAVDDQSGKRVALKRSIFERPEDARIFEQIETEYKVSRQVEHPYLRKCHKLIKNRKLMKLHEILLSMEMFEGRTLEDTKSLSLIDCLLVFRMIATGLNAMHAKGFIHCDIKPNNILISHQGSIRIIDLGQSCKIGTVKSRIQGTPDYIAPEQVHRERLDQRTDIFNLGATMYWAFTGKHVPTLIPQGMNAGLPVEVPRGPVKAPHQIHNRINPGASKLIMECIQEDRTARPSSMSEVISRLDLLIHSIFGKKIQKNVTTNT